MLWCNPVALDHPDGMIAPEGSFLGIDGNDRESKIPLGIRLHDHALVKNCSREVFRSIRKHFAPEEPSVTAVVHHALFDTSQKLRNLRFFEIAKLQAGRFAGSRIRLGKEGD